MTVADKAVQDDVWVHSACDCCFTACGILAHRVNGKVVKIEGDPECPHNWGRVCAKGQAGVIDLYDPSRLKVPMKRTNPEKGPGVDPGWQPIGFEEAYDLIAKRLAAVRADDPRKVVLCTFDHMVMPDLVPAWCTAFGTPNSNWAGYYCGNAMHSTMHLTNGTFSSDFDLDRCNYLILLGNQHGFQSGVAPNIGTQKMADARMRGLRVVVVDPVCTHGGSKADEWVPIRPGTDGALMSAMLHVVLHELKVIDTDFVRQYTNAPYLVQPDGLYARNAAGEPLVWDVPSGSALPHDQAAEPALEGTYTVGGHQCQTAFQLLHEHVRGYTPEWAERISTIPAANIRRLTREFVAAAQIGSSITIDGKTMPYRPVAVNCFRGAGAHTHGLQTILMAQILNMLVGAFYRPGSHWGVNLVGPGFSFQPSAIDGLVAPAEGVSHRHGSNYYHWDVKPPQTMGLYELFPFSTNRSPVYQQVCADPDGFHLPYYPEAMIICRRNHFMTNGSVEQTRASLKHFKFIVYIGTHLDETAEYADIAMPDAHYLERMDVFPNKLHNSVLPGTGYFYWGLRQPVVEPPPGVLSWTETLFEIADRMGMLPDVYRILNDLMFLKEPYRLDPNRKYTRAEIFDRRAKSTLGPDRGWDWLKEHGYHKVPRTVDELYPLDKLKVRFPLYYENVLRMGRDIAAVTTGINMEWDTSDYSALPVWQPCPAYRDQPGDGLYAVAYKLPLMNRSVSAQNPWLQEISQLTPYAQSILINSRTARQLGIADGDTIELASAVGTTQGKAKVTELVHPEVLGMGWHFGAFARGKPIARGHGPHFNNLLAVDMAHTDKASGGGDSCVRVTVRRV